MTEKIHCDLMEVYGPDWATLNVEQIDCLANTIHSNQQLFGNEPELYGFVGTRRMENIVGGYFVIQYYDEEYHYTKNKEFNIKTSHPFAKIFFTFFAKSGKLLLQNTKFVGIPLSMYIAQTKFRSALDQVFESCGVRRTFNIAVAPDETEEADFMQEYERSTRVIRLEVEYPTSDGIPDDFVYYNPQIERNNIIRNSHRHDYPHLKKVDLEATDGGDLKQTHLRDLIYAGKLQEMHYYVGLDSFTLRKDVKRKFEFHIDMDSEQLSEEHLQAVVEMLRRERTVFLETPTPTSNSSDNQQSNQQMSLFGDQI